MNIKEILELPVGTYNALLKGKKVYLNVLFVGMHKMEKLVTIDEIDEYALNKYFQLDSLSVGKYIKTEINICGIVLKGKFLKEELTLIQNNHG